MLSEEFSLRSYPSALLLAATWRGVCHCLSRVLESALCLSKTSTVACKYENNINHFEGHNKKYTRYLCM